jgi:hypothetical protein
MEEDTLPPEFSTKPPKVNRDIGPHSVLVRLHQSDWEMLQVMLKRDGLSFQKFASYCARAYMDGDPNIIKCIRTYRSLDLVPRDQVEKGVFSNRERLQIYEELEKSQMAEEEKKG